MHSLKASRFWRMTFSELGEWMWGVGPYWNILGLDGKIKKKLYREFTSLSTHLIKNIYTDETGVNVDIGVGSSHIARLVYYRSDKAGYELREFKLFLLAQGWSGYEPITINLTSPSKTVIGTCLKNLIK